MPELCARAVAEDDRDRMLAMLMEEWSLTQDDLMDRLHAEDLAAASMEASRRRAFLEVPA